MSAENPLDQYHDQIASKQVQMAHLARTAMALIQEADSSATAFCFDDGVHRILVVKSPDDDDAEAQEAYIDLQQAIDQLKTEGKDPAVWLLEAIYQHVPTNLLKFLTTEIQNTYTALKVEEEHNTDLLDR